MNMEIENDLPLKPYLLGDLNPDEQQRIEQRLMIDSAASEELSWVEDELIDDYLEGALSGREKEKFENFFLSAPERRQKLGFAKALKRYVAANRLKENPWSILWNSWQAFWRPQNLVLRWALAASLLLIIAGGSWSVLRISGLRTALEQAETRESRNQLAMQNRNSELALSLQHEQARSKLLEQEMVNIKTVNKRGFSSLLPGQLQSLLIAVTLTPGLTRDLGSSQKISIPTGTDLAQLDLKLESQDYPQFQATLQSVDEGRILTQIFPKTKSGMRGQFLRLIMPANELRPGDYVLKLSGITAAGDFEDIESYYFRVIPK